MFNLFRKPLPVEPPPKPASTYDPCSRCGCHEVQHYDDGTRSGKCLVSFCECTGFVQRGAKG